MHPPSTSDPATLHLTNPGWVQMPSFSPSLRPQDKDMELSTANMKLQQLEAELQDLSSQESKDEASLAKVKKQLRDLEAKVKDQEEELDEQAGSIQMLEQVQDGADYVILHQRGGLHSELCFNHFIIPIDRLSRHFDTWFTSNFRRHPEILV